MSGENRKRKRKNRFHRWLAMALTVAMLAGQGKVDVWAQEGADDVPPAAESSEEIKTDAVEDSGAEDNNSDPDQDDENNGGSGDQDTEDDNSPAKGEEPEEGKNTEENGDTENHNPEDVGQENADGQDVCVCETRCTEDAVNADCPVCAADYAACAGKDADDTEKNDTENHDPEGDGQENADGIGKEMEEILPETVSGNTLDGEAEIAVLADEGVEAYAVGDTFTYDGINYAVTGDGEVEVDQQGEDAVSGDIVIPASFERDGVTYRVTSMRLGAFRSCSSLTSVQIPAGMTSISEAAFDGCSGLTSVEIPKSVTSIENFAFDGCSSLRSIEIPDSVTRIGQMAFQDCSGLTSVKIPASVTSIGDAAFGGCSSLSSVEIPASVTSIGIHVFDNCSSLTSVEIPDGVTSIGGGAFSACSSLSSVKIPDSVTSIGNNAFDGCSSLSRVEIPASVTRVGNAVFYSCSSLRSIEIPASVTSIGANAFEYCSNLTSVTMSENITRIWNFAFRSCEKLKELRIVSPSGKFQFPAVDTDAFAFIPDERYIIFVDEAGNELAGEAYEAAKNAFIEAAKVDGTDDGRWYGWSLEGVSPSPGGSSGRGDGSGDNGNPGGSSGNSGGDSDSSDFDSGNGTENIQMTLVSETASAPAENSAADSTGTTPISGGQEAGTGAAGTSVSKDGADGTEEKANGGEPETGDTTHIEIYATVAMIAGLTYLLLYFTEEGRGMTEREKEVFVAAFIRWGKKGGAFRRGCAVVVIFCLLVYYHSIGKCADKNTYLCYTE